MSMTKYVKCEDGMYKIEGPALAQNEDDFAKQLFAVNMTIIALVSDGKMDLKEAMGLLVDSTKLIAHDYYELVTAGKMPRFEFYFDSKEKMEELLDTYKEAMSVTGVQFAMSGVPMEEDNKGNLKINFKEVQDRADKELRERRKKND